MKKLTRYTALILFAFYSVFAFADTSSGPGRMGESGMMGNGMMDGGMMIFCMFVGLLVLALLVLGILALVKFLRPGKS